jgi:hypothetical protein
MQLSNSWSFMNVALELNLGRLRIVQAAFREPWCPIIDMRTILAWGDHRYGVQMGAVSASGLKSALYVCQSQAIYI